MRIDHLKLTFVGDFSKSLLKDIAACPLLRFVLTYLSLSCHTFPKALYISRNTPLTPLRSLSEADLGLLQHPRWSNL